MKLVVGAIACLVALILVQGCTGKGDKQGLRTEKGKAGNIRVKNDSATMYADKNYFVTKTRGPVGSEGIPAEIRIGDTMRVKDRVLNVNHIFWTRYLDRMQYGGEVLAEAGDVQCVLVATEEDLPYSDEYRDRLWIVVKQCEVIKQIDSAEGTGSTKKADLQTALGQYKKAVGVYPKEFLGFSAVQQEAYLRGGLDGQYFLLETSKHPDRDGFVNCLNAKLKTILSGAKGFVEREGEQDNLMPWTLSRLVGQSCPKETRIPLKNSPEYTEAANYLKTISIAKKPSDPIYSEEEQDAIDKAFIRGVLDGKVFGLYGHNYPKLIAYLECLSKPGNLDTIFRSMRISQDLGQNLDKSQAFNVVQGEASVCKEFNE